MMERMMNRGGRFGREDFYGNELAMMHGLGPRSHTMKLPEPKRPNVPVPKAH